MGNKCDIPPEDNINTHQQAYFPSPQISSSDNFKCSLSITCIGRTLRSPGWGHGYVLTPHNWAATGCRFDVLRFSKDLKRPKPSRVFVQWEDNHGVDLTGQTGPTANKAVRVFQVTSVKAWTGRPIGWTRGIQITSGSNMFKRFRQFQQFMIQHSSDNTSWLSITKHHLASLGSFATLHRALPWFALSDKPFFLLSTKRWDLSRRNTSMKIMKEQKCVPTVCPRSLHRGCSLSHRPTHPVATQWTWWRPSINKLHPAVPSVSSHSPNSTKNNSVVSVDCLTALTLHRIVPVNTHSPPVVAHNVLFLHDRSPPGLRFHGTGQTIDLRHTPKTNTRSY